MAAKSSEALASFTGRAGTPTTGLHLNPSADAYTGANVDPLAEHRLIIYDTAGIQNDRIANLATVAHDDSGANHVVSPKRDG